MSEIKVGDWVAVKVAENSPSGALWVEIDGQNWRSIRPGFFKEIPQPDPHAKSKEAVVDTAVAKYVVMTSPGIRDNQLLNKVCAEHDFAVLNLIDAQRPPDLVAELQNAWEMRSKGYGGTAQKIEDAISALEAERDRRKG